MSGAQCWLVWHGHAWDDGRYVVAVFGTEDVATAALAALRAYEIEWHPMQSDKDWLAENPEENSDYHLEAKPFNPANVVAVEEEA